MSLPSVDATAIRLGKAEVSDQDLLGIYLFYFKLCLGK